MKFKWMIAVAAMSVVTVVAAGCGGGNAGSQAAASQAPAAASSSQGSNGQGAPAATPGAGQNAGRQFNPDNFAAGQVSKIDGSTITLTTNNGEQTVKANDQTQYEKMVQASLSDIQTGERVTAQGTRNADGTFSAQMIQIGNPRGSQGSQGSQGSRGTPGPRQGGNGGQGQGGQNGGQNGGRQFNPNNFTGGQVSKIDGNTLTLTAANGVAVTVKTDNQTRIQKLGQGSLSDIKTGERITARGTCAADGTFTAQTIQIGGGQPGGGNSAQAPANTNSSN